MGVLKEPDTIEDLLRTYDVKPQLVVDDENEDDDDDDDNTYIESSELLPSDNPSQLSRYLVNNDDADSEEDDDEVSQQVPRMINVYNEAEDEPNGETVAYQNGFNDYLNSRPKYKKFSSDFDETSQPEG